MFCYILNIVMMILILSVHIMKCLFTGKSYNLVWFFLQGRVVLAPLFYVNFADFWLADQLNSLVVVFIDFQFLICFYLTNDTWMSANGKKPTLFLIIKPTRCTDFSNLFLEWNSACFRQFLCPSSGVFHCTHSNGRKLSVNLYDIYHCCVYSEKLLMMDRGTVRNM